MKLGYLKAVNQVELDLVGTEVGIAGDPRILVPEALYEAQATGYKIVPFRGGLEKIYLRMRITSFGDYLGEEIWAVFQTYDRYSPRSYFYKAWTVAKGRVPARKEKLKVGDLCGNIYSIKARTVTTDEDGNPHHPSMYYSLAKIVSLIQGSSEPEVKSDKLVPNTNYRLPTSPSLNKRKKKGFK